MSIRLRDLAALAAALPGGYLGGSLALATLGREWAVDGAFVGALAFVVFVRWLLSPETTTDPRVARGWIDEAVGIAGGPGEQELPGKGEHLPPVEMIFSEETSARKMAE